MSIAWVHILIFVFGLLAGAAMNLFILGLAIGRYEGKNTEKMQGLVDDISENKRKIATLEDWNQKFREKWAAITREVDGIDYGKIGGRNG